MARNVIEGGFRSSKMAAGSQVAHWSEMARNAIKRDFYSSKMAAGSHFVNKIPEKKKLSIDLKWREMRSKVIFGDPKWPPAAILWKKILRNKKLHIDLKWREMRSKFIFGHPKWGGGGRDITMASL